MNWSYKKLATNILLFLIIYFSTLLLGWQSVSFIYIYHSMDEGIIFERMTQWSSLQPSFIGLGVIFTLLFLPLKQFLGKKNQELHKSIQIQMILQGLFLLLIFLNITLLNSNIHLNVLELAAFLFALWLLVRWGSIFFHSNRPGWHHPTTHGTFYIAAFIIGCALLDIFNLIKIQDSNLKYLILVLLAFELFILYSRFHYLSTNNQETNRIAKELFGSLFLFFGTRIIIGIFMPAIFILYTLLIKGKSVEGIAVLLLMGTLMERYLFVRTGE
jgi:DMSO reductase anchor subunit